ncbi:MAG: hypothetical protein ACTSU5_10915 [Promethearchaeota archaeon]
MIDQLPDDVAGQHTIQILDVEFLYYLFVATVLAVWLYFGVIYLIRSVHEENLAQRAYWRGFGIFVTLAAAFEVLFVADMFYEIYGGNPLLNRAEDYGIASINYSDFFVVMPSVMAVCAGLLIRPVEKYMYKKETCAVSRLYFVLSPVPAVARVFEVNLDDWFGLDLVWGSLPFFVMTAVWVFVLVMAVLTGVFIVGYYHRVGQAAPPGSKIRRKVVEIEAGIVVWAVGMSTTLWARQELWKFWAPQYPYGPMFLFWTPAFLLAALVLLTSGFSRIFGGGE